MSEVVRKDQDNSCSFDKKKKTNRILIVVGGFAFLALAAVYFFFDPVEAYWMPRCLWKVLTGTDCPGCGSQRMAHALMHGDFRAAWNANAYALCVLPVVMAMFWLELNRERYPDIYRKVHAPWVIWTFAGSILLWWIFRNLI